MRISLIVVLLGVVGGLAQDCTHGFHHGVHHTKDAILSKRRPGNSDTSIRSLFDKIKSTVTSALKAVDVKQISHDMEDIKQMATSILDQAHKNIDVKRVEEIIIDTSFPIMHILLSKHSTKIEFTVRLLDRLAAKLLQDKSAAYDWVAAIKLVANASVAVLDDFNNWADADADKRQATWGAHVNRGPAGTSEGISGSYTTSGGTTYGGHVERDPFNHIGGGLSASHTWSHGDGSKTTLGGHVDHSPYGGNSGGISLSHTFGRRQVVVEQKRQWTTTGSIEHGPGGTNVGASVGRTWSHENGGKTSVSGNVGYGSKSGGSVGVGITHTFGKRSDE